MPITSTKEQDTIIENAVKSRNNLLINAYAGTGKSTTLRMVERVLPKQPILYLAFNKRVVDEIAYKSRAEDHEKRMQSTTTVKTLNGLGHGIWSRYRNCNLTLNAKKTSDILRAVIDEMPKKHQGPVWDSFSQITSGVGMAKSMGHIPEGKFPDVKRLCTPTELYAKLDEDPDDLICEMIDVVLNRSIIAAFAGNIDFDDQVYMPALFGGIFPKFPTVMVDEYQDINICNHTMIAKLAKTSRIIGVGDRFQNIYGFRGAVAKGMDDATTQHQMSGHTLSISFRCPEAVVVNSHWHVPDFRWTTPGGRVETLDTILADDVADGSIFLCRNNAPLFRTAMRFLAHGRSVEIAGTDIAKRLVTTMRKLGDESLTQFQALSAVDYWLEARTAKASKTAEDLAECMRVFIRHATTLGTAIAYAEHLLSARGALYFSTGHKSKGLEWQTVYHLDPHLLKMSDDQDRNLKYVIETRAKENLFIISSDTIDFGKNSNVTV